MWWQYLPIAPASLFAKPVIALSTLATHANGCQSREERAMAAQRFQSFRMSIILSLIDYNSINVSSIKVFQFPNLDLVYTPPLSSLSEVMAGWRILHFESSEGSYHLDCLTQSLSMYSDNGHTKYYARLQYKVIQYSLVKEQTTFM